MDILEWLAQYPRIRDYTIVFTTVLFFVLFVIRFERE